MGRDTRGIAIGTVLSDVFSRMRRHEDPGLWHAPFCGVGLAMMRVSMPLVLAGLGSAAILFIAADTAYREFFVKPLGVAYLLETFPDISSVELPTAAPEMIILSPVAFEAGCHDWSWGCYTVEAYRGVAHVYVMRQHGGLNEVLPCDRADCSEGRDYAIKELSREEWQSAEAQANLRGNFVKLCYNKSILLYDIEVCRQDFLFDGVIGRSVFVLRVPHQLALRAVLDSDPDPEVAYYVNYVAASKQLGGNAAHLLKRSM